MIFSKKKQVNSLKIYNLQSTKLYQIFNFFFVILRNKTNK